MLCTDNQTYSLHEAPTSNSLLLATPQDDDTMNVVDDLSYIIEIKPCLPRLERITTLLQSTMYAGPAAESSIQGKVRSYIDTWIKNDIIDTVYAAPLYLSRYAVFGASQ